MISELGKVETSQNLETLLKVLEKISSLGEEYSSDLVKSGKFQLASDVQKQVADAYDKAAEMISTDRRFRRFKSVSESFRATADYWRRRTDSSVREAVSKLRTEGNVLQGRSQYEKSLEYYDKALEIDPTDPISWLEKGNSLYSMGKFGEAINCYDKTVEIDPNNPHAFCYKGLALTSLGLYRDALKYFDLALNKDEKLEFAFVGRGWTYFKLESYEEAKKAYEDALALNDQSTEARRGLSMVYHDGLYNDSMARRHLEEALKLQERVDLKADLSEVLLASDNYERAEQLAKDVLEAAPDQYGYPMRLVRVCSLYLSKQTKEATVAARDLIEYYKAVRGKQVLTWSFRGLKETIRNKEMPSNVKDILLSFISLAEDYDDAAKTRLLMMLPLKIQIVESYTFTEKIISSIKGVFKGAPQQEKSKAESQPRIRVINTSKPDPEQPGWYYWEIHLAPQTALNHVERVIYTLHETFPKPVRPVTDRESGFRLESKGWGEFQVKVQIHFDDGRQPITRYHWLKLGLATLEEEPE